MVDFKPSDVDLDCFATPLPSTFRKVEREIAAALVVRALQLSGDTWRPATVPMLRLVEAEESTTLGKALRNPFYGCDTNGLVNAGFARLDEYPTSLSFTDEGLDVLGLFIETTRLSRLGFSSLDLRLSAIFKPTLEDVLLVFGEEAEPWLTS